MSALKEKVAERSSEELLDILENEQDRYPRNILKIIKEVLEERGVDIENVKEKKRKTLVESTKSSTKDSKDDLENKYRPLRIIIGLLKFATLLFLFLIGVLSFFLIQGSILNVTVLIILAIVIIVPYFALSYVLSLFIDIEKNTRQNKELLEKITKENK